MTSSASAPQAAPAELLGATRGLLTAIGDTGEVCVDFPSNRSGAPVAAVATVSLEPSDVGCEVVLVFEDNDATRPIVLGVLKPPVSRPSSSSVEVTADGRRVTVDADEEIVLRCGEASITLTRAGKVLIRGTYVLSRSSGANRIKGGSVEIN